MSTHLEHEQLVAEHADGQLEGHWHAEDPRNLQQHTDAVAEPRRERGGERRGEAQR